MTFGEGRRSGGLQSRSRCRRLLAQGGVLGIWFVHAAADLCLAGQSFVVGDAVGHQWRAEN